MKLVATKGTVDWSLIFDPETEERHCAIQHYWNVEWQGGCDQTWGGDTSQGKNYSQTVFVHQSTKEKTFQLNWKIFGSNWDGFDNKWIRDHLHWTRLRKIFFFDLLDRGSHVIEKCSLVIMEQAGWWQARCDSDYRGCIQQVQWWMELVFMQSVTENKKIIFDTHQLAQWLGVTFERWGEHIGFSV